jgi:hypothetical protein
MESRRGMDGLDVPSLAALTIATSSASPGTGPWSSSGFVEEDEDAAGLSWEEEKGLLLIPKLEPADDNMDMLELSPMSDQKEIIIPEALSSSSITLAKVKRPRGRPRKHAELTPELMAKVRGRRSKTGCITCRKRKKKCDETKPGCRLA